MLVGRQKTQDRLPLHSTELIRSFSPLQYYFAQARNTVHLIIGVPREVSATEFHDLVGQIMTDTPQLMWRESLSAGGYLTGGRWAAR